MPSAEQPVTKLGGGINQIGGRAYNERLVLSLIRIEGQAPKAELARMTGLSAQTLTLIVNRLEADGLVTRRPPRRGKVGQPSVPYTLNPDAAFSFGLKIGRRSVELVLADFLGRIRTRAREDYEYPRPDQVFSFVSEHTRRMRRNLSRAVRTRIVGIGVAMPFEIWNWQDHIPQASGALDTWRELDVERKVAALTRLPAILANDATAACAAEILNAEHDARTDFAYLFVGWFIGGGIVLNGSLYPGGQGNAGAFGSMLVSSNRGRPVQLLRRASLHVLEEMLHAQGLDPNGLWTIAAQEAAFRRTVRRWIRQAGRSIAEAIVNASSVIDFQAVVIDGAMPEELRDSLVGEVRQACSSFDRRGLSDLDVVPGNVGADARATGAAMLPILTNFTRDREVLFKDLSGP